MKLEWIGAGDAVLDGVKVRYANSDYDKQKTTAEEIVVLKPKAYFDAYMKMVADPNMRFNIVEFGIFEGGSAMILAAMFPNARIEAFDIRPSSAAVLSHLERMQISDRVRLHYGASQDNEAYITGIIKNNLNGVVDFVLDDASHNYALTKASLEILWQFLSEDGIYLIEDWGWAHWPGPGYDEWTGVAMSNLILELVMSSASHEGLIKSVFANAQYAMVKKGPTVLKKRLVIDDILKIAPRHWSKIQS